MTAERAVRWVMRQPNAIDLALAGLALGFAGGGCRPVETAVAAENPDEHAVQVRLAKVARGPITRKVHASGVLHLKSEADLSFKVGGVVTKVAADAGSRVRKGQVLATVDPTEMQAGSSQAAEAVQKAQRDVERVRSLVASGSVGSVELQNATTALQVARAAAEAAQFNLRQTTLVAPDDGVIDRRMIEVGEFAAPGRPAFHLRGVSRGVIVRAALTDRDVLSLRRGDLARVTLDARPGTALTAHVSQIATSASPGTGTFEVELRLQDADAAQLPSGLTAKVEIDRVERPLATIPLAALVDGHGDAAAVYVVQGDRAKRVPVQVGFLADDRAALVAGLERADQVVELGAGQLDDGALVRVSE